MAGALDPEIPLTASFLFGTRELYDWVHLNRSVRMMRTERTNDPGQIARQARMTSVNAALQVDSSLTRYQAASATRELAQKRLDAETSKFEVGMSTNFFVVQAQRDLADAQNAELRALLDYRKALVDFQRAQEAPSTGRSSGGLTTVTGGNAASSGAGLSEKSKSSASSAAASIGTPSMVRMRMVGEEPSSGTSAAARVCPAGNRVPGSSSCSPGGAGRSDPAGAGHAIITPRRASARPIDSRPALPRRVPEHLRASRRAAHRGCRRAAYGRAFR